MKPGLSLVDVAKRANVSISTVSRVINNTGKISAETQEAIRQVMRELGYRPNRVARRLRASSGKRNLLGLIIPNIQNPFFADLARGVEDTAYAHNFGVMLCNYDEDAAKEAFYLNVMESESVDGIILPPAHERDPAVLRLVNAGLPMVTVDRTLAIGAIDKVEVDNHRGAYDAVAYLLNKGHRRIGIIDGPAQSSTGRERLLGYRSAHTAAAVDVDEQLVRYGDFKQESGRRLTEELLGLPQPPTALFVCNGLMTIGALDAVFAAGLRIPGQLALVGFDDLPLASVFDPPLTVVRQPAYEVGRSAAELLFKRFDEPKRPPTGIRLLPELVVRRSA